MKAPLEPDEVAAALEVEGWWGFTLVRRFLSERPGEARLLARRLRSVDWDSRGDADARRVRFAFLAGGSTESLRDPLLLESLSRGVVPVSYHAPPGRVAREVDDPTSGLWACGPDVVVVAAAPGETDLGGARDGGDEALVDAVANALRRLRRRSEAVLLVHGFLAPEQRPLGLGDWREKEGLGARTARLNLALAERIRELPGAYLVDVAPLAALGGVRWWTLHRSAFVAGLGFPEELAPHLCREYAAAGAALRGLVRKCLVVDLDETLWGGVVGEVGAGGVQVGGGHPGNVYREIQRAILRLHESGVVLAVNSRNDEADAWEPFAGREEMVLRREHFAAWRLNWQDKVQNLRELSAELGLGLEAFVVLDDDPVNRRWIEEQLPEVHVLPAEDPMDMLRALATTRLFEGLGRTEEDRLRVLSYAAAPRRRSAEQTAADRAAFLAELDLVVTVGRACAAHLPRLAQLTQRTNQFNLTARRYTEAQLAALLESPEAVLLYAACRDRFADEGVTGFAMMRGRGGEWTLDVFLLSCRVLGWGVERALAAAACRVAAQEGAEVLVGEYDPTPKNRQAESFYRDLGFTPSASGEAGSTWRCELPGVPDPTPSWIRLELSAEAPSRGSR